MWCMYFKCTCVLLESRSNSGAGLDSSNSGEDPVSLAPPAPRVQHVGRGIAKSKSDVQYHRFPQKFGVEQHFGPL